MSEILFWKFNESGWMVNSADKDTIFAENSPVILPVWIETRWSVEAKKHKFSLSAKEWEGLWERRGIVVTRELLLRAKAEGATHVKIDVNGYSSDRYRAARESVERMGVLPLWHYANEGQVRLDANGYVTIVDNNRRRPGIWLQGWETSIEFCTRGRLLACLQKVGVKGLKVSPRVEIEAVERLKLPYPIEWLEAEDSRIWESGPIVLPVDITLLDSLKGSIDPKQTFGVELELSGEGSYETRNASWFDKHYNEGWRAKSDLSIPENYSYGNGEGTEYISKPYRAEDMDKFQASLRALLMDADGRHEAEDGCGLHVHLDRFCHGTNLRRWAKSSVWRTYTALVPTLKRVFPEILTDYRFDNSHCIEEFSDCSRYHSVNFCSTHGTIEFRQGAATMRLHSIVQWVETLLAIVAHCAYCFEEGLDPVEVLAKKPSPESIAMRLPIEQFSRLMELAGASC